jgi:hypothetical protein
MAQKAGNDKAASIRLACQAFGISQTCYRYQAKLSPENAEIAAVALHGGSGATHQQAAPDLEIIINHAVKQFFQRTSMDHFNVTDSAPKGDANRAVHVSPACMGQASVQVPVVTTSPARKSQAPGHRRSSTKK